MSTPTSAKPLLFLAFNGILTMRRRGTGNGAEAASATPDLQFAPTLAELLVPWLDRLDLVVTATWARGRDLDTVRAALPAPLAQHTIGTVWTAGTEPEVSRFDRIQRWIEQNRPNAKTWLAIDTDASGWPEHMRSHLACCTAPLCFAWTQREVIRGLIGSFGFVDPLHSARGMSPEWTADRIETLFDRWKLDTPTRLKLLGLDDDWEPPQQPEDLPFDVLDRAERLLGLHAALHLLSPGDLWMRWSWVNHCNPAFNHRRPLAVMLDDGVAGIERVARLLRSQLTG